MPSGVFIKENIASSIFKRVTRFSAGRGGASIPGRSTAVLFISRLDGYGWFFLGGMDGIRVGYRAGADNLDRS